MLCECFKFSYKKICTGDGKRERHIERDTGRERQTERERTRPGFLVVKGEIIRD